MRSPTAKPDTPAPIAIAASGPTKPEAGVIATSPATAPVANPSAVGCFSVGTNQVDLLAARKRGIPVFNAPFSNTRSVAELVIGEIVILLRRIVARSNAAHQGRWDKSANDSYEVRGKTLGIIGYGNIGSQLSNLAEAMGMRVIFYDHTDRLRHGNTEPVASLRELLAQSDVVSLHVPLTAETHHLINVTKLAKMKPDAILINTARGAIVEEAALVRALQTKQIAGAGLDVFEHEPKVDKRLRAMSNVVLTPHLGSATPEVREEMAKIVVDNILAFLEGRKLPNCVNPQVFAL